MTLLRRLGNKAKLAKDIQAYFPQHKQYVELFFGGGGMFFNKPKARYNIVNDNDSDVYNLFMVVMNSKEELINHIKMMPVHNDLWNYWRQNKEVDPIKRAVRFLFLSNYGYMGKDNTLRVGANNTTSILLGEIDKTFDLLFGVYFLNCDFRDVPGKISFKDDKERSDTFIYADPPYLDTTNNYESEFSEKDSYDLFDILQDIRCKWAMSEFDHPFIISEAQRRGLNTINLGSRINLKNRRVEVLITNYNTSTTLF